MQDCTNVDLNMDTKQIRIDCKLGLWAFQGENIAQVINDAMFCFKQYKRDGMYDNLLREMKCQK